MGKYMSTRRDFMKQAAMFAAASAALSACAAPTTGGAPAAGAPAAAPAAGAREIQPGVLRSETLILENPTGRVTPADDFNRWRPGSNTYSTGFQQLALDAYRRAARRFTARW